MVFTVGDWFAGSDGVQYYIDLGHAPNFPEFDDAWHSLLVVFKTIQGPSTGLGAHTCWAKQSAWQRLSGLDLNSLGYIDWCKLRGQLFAVSFAARG